MPKWHEAQEADKRKESEPKCARLGWKFIPFVMDVFGGFGPEAERFVILLLKGLLGQREGWQRRALEASVWQEIGYTLAREVARQLVWSVFAAGEPEHAPATHQPYH